MKEFGEMKKSNKLMEEKDTYDALKKCTHITVSTKLENGYPYSIPVNHVYEDGKIYFHCAHEGLKVDAFKLDDKVCISAVETEEILASKFSTAFRSVTAFGKVSLVSDEEERIKALTALIKRFSPDFYDEGIKYIEKLKDKTALYSVKIKHITGKSSINYHSE